MWASREKAVTEPVSVKSAAAIVSSWLVRVQKVAWSILTIANTGFFHIINVFSTKDNFFTQHVVS